MIFQDRRRESGPTALAGEGGEGDRLRLFQRQFPDAIVTPGHDPDFYPGLAKRYE